MGLFDFMRNLGFFKGRSTEGLVEEDLDFNKWITAHRDWRRRLQNFISGNSEESLDETVICRDDRCALGGWIHDHGTRFYGELHTFKSLVNDHAAFHRAAADVVIAYKRTGERDARKLLHEDFDQCSMRVVAGLESLERQVKG